MKAAARDSGSNIIIFMEVRKELQIIMLLSPLHQQYVMWVHLLEPIRILL